VQLGRVLQYDLSTNNATIITTNNATTITANNSSTIGKSYTCAAHIAIWSTYDASSIIQLPNVLHQNPTNISIN
jgi:hypothetical protein